MKLREYLRASQIRHADFARQLHVDPSTVSRWLAGKSQPRISQAIAIESATGGAVPVGSWDSTVNPPSGDGTEAA